MKYLKTKHERNSAKITGLTVLIIALLLFVVGPPYKEIPEEYGVAINFGEPSVVNNKVAADSPSKAEEIIDDTQEEITDYEELTEEESIEEEEVEEVEEVTEEEIKQEQAEIEALEKTLEEEKAEAKAKEEASKQEAAEKLLAQQEEEALKIKEAKEVAEKLEAEKKAKEKIEAEKLAAAKAKSEREEKARADKAEADRIAKAKAARETKAKADKAAAAKAKADADLKAAAAAAKNNNGGSDVVGFAVIEQAPIYPGCEGLDNTARKSCMSRKMQQFVAANFDQTIASDLGFTGNQKISIYFKISKTGQIIDIRAKAVDPKLEQEAVRVTKMLPKLKPGIQQGKPVIVPFSVPIRFKAKQ